MSESLNRFVEELRRRRAMRAGAKDVNGHLSEATLHALADGSLGSSETAAARDHIAECLECLNAYGELRALWEIAATPEARTWQRAVQSLRKVVEVRVPAWIIPVAAAVPVAAVAILWLRLSSGITFDSA